MTQEDCRWRGLEGRRYVRLPDDVEFRRLHRGAIQAPSDVLKILCRLRDDRIELRRGMNRRVEAERAWIIAVDQSGLTLRTESFEIDQKPQLFLNFCLDGVPYFLSATRRLDQSSLRSSLRLRIPEVIYCAERRDRDRVLPQSGGWRHVELRSSKGQCLTAEVENYSPGGIRIRLPESEGQFHRGSVLFRFPDGSHLHDAHGHARYSERVIDRPGWLSVGFTLTPNRSGEPVPIEGRKSLFNGDIRARARARLGFLAETARSASARVAQRLVPAQKRLPLVNVVRYANEDAEPIVAIVDSCGDTRGALAVVIPPAWGRTKETLMPLARVIVESFAAANQPVFVVRFDGIRKRGESYNDPDCRVTGREHHRFTFSQGVRDIQATLDFLRTDARFCPSRTVLLTFSAASIEGRRCVVLEGGNRIDAWVCVVGAADCQSMMRVISGGVDFAGGYEKGLRFGLQEILGIEVDIDHAASDALYHQLMFLEDARRDFAAIKIPVTWFHGRDDAWMDLQRVQDAMSQGAASNRRIIEMPTGHQLKSSRQALEMFQAITSEIARLGLDLNLKPSMPDLTDLRERQKAERARRPKYHRNLQGFWRNYLLGRDDGSMGIELMHRTRHYQRLMELQIDALEPKAGQFIADIGCGVGNFGEQLSRSRCDVQITVHGYDYVREALVIAATKTMESLDASYIEARLERNIPAAAGRYDSVLASLFLSYVPDAKALMSEIQRVLKPGGRLVMSTLTKDADISRIYSEGVEELTAALKRERLPRQVLLKLNRSMRTFLNDASRLLDLEEEGAFQFWEEDELRDMLASAGFRTLAVLRAFGDPPQAMIVAAERA